MRIPILFCAAAIIGFSAQGMAQVTQGQTSLRQTHGRWTSIVLTDGPAKITRISTSGENDDAVLTVSFFPPSCLQDISTIFDYGKALQTDKKEVPVNLTIRVDSGRPFLVPGFSRGSMGDRYGFVELEEFTGFTEILRAMSAGSKVRIKYDFGYDTATISYSLFGFTEAFNRAHTLCLSLSKPQVPPSEQRRPRMPPIESMPRKMTPL